MEYYERLNKILENTLRDKNRAKELTFLKETVKLAKIIIDNTPNIVKESFKEYVSLNDSLNIVGDFLYNLNDNYSSFYLWLAREDLEIGIKSFHFYIDQAISKIDKDKMDKELTSKVRELFKESNQNMSDIETLRLNHGKTALYLATHLLNDSKVTNISNLESFKMKKLGTFSGTKLNLKEKSECV